MKKIAFVGANDLMVPYINELALTHQVTVFDSGTFGVPLSSTVTLVPLKKSFLGLDRTASERSWPFSMEDLGSALQVVKPDTIIVLDFIRLWYWQVLSYRVSFPKTQVHVYSETQRIPRHPVSMLGFVVFFVVFWVTQKLLTSYLTFTDRGFSFARRAMVFLPIQVLTPPIDTELFTPAQAALRQPAPLRLLLNARYAPYKRHGDVLRALVFVKARGVAVTLTCIGRSGTGRSLVELEAKMLGVADQVTFCEPVSRLHMPQIYHAHDALILPSDNEAIGMVVPEAMACGLATITSDTVGANTYVLPGKTGYVTLTGNVSALAESIIALAQNDTVVSFGQAARTRALDFTIAQLAGRFRACTLVDT